MPFWFRLGRVRRMILNLQQNKPIPLVPEDGRRSLSGTALAELLKDVLRKGSPLTLRARGFSMSPFIKDGDDVTLFPMNGVSPGLGDVAAYIHEGTGMPFIHRVVGKKGNTYLLKGDNATEADGLICESNILGCVRIVERRGLRVFFGLGPERFLIAFLTRRGLLSPLLVPPWKLVRPIMKRWFA